LINRLNRILKNPFINASLFSGVSAVVKMATALLIGKIVAEISGATGILLYGQLLSVVLIVSLLAGGALNQGFVKYIAEYDSVHKEKLPGLISTAFKTTVVLSVAIGIIVIVFSSFIATYVLYNEQYASIIVYLGLFLIFYSLNNFALSVLNGFQRFKKYSVLNIALSTTGLVITIVLSYYLNIYGALLSLVTSQSVVFLITLFFVRNESWFAIAFFDSKFDYSELKKLTKFGIMVVLASITPAISAIIIRNYIAQELSIFNAGIYEFTMRIATSALMLFSMTVSIYYIPKLSEISTIKNLLTEVKNTLVIVIPFSLSSLVFIYLIRDFVIVLLGSKEFLASSGLIFYVLLGVFFKICTQVYGFVFVAKAKIRIIIIIEVLFNVCFTMASIILIQFYEIYGAVVAFTVCNFIYLIGVYITFKSVFREK